ncbi:TPA: 16S rRNA (guanine(966)-N(2))-methyltransferase RsmD, partial [Neisseria meningitidis]
GAYVYIEAGRQPDKPDWLTEYREGKSGQSTFELRVFQVAE